MIPLVVHSLKGSHSVSNRTRTLSTDPHTRVQKPTKAMMDHRYYENETANTNNYNLTEEPPEGRQSAMYPIAIVPVKRDLETRRLSRPSSAGNATKSFSRVLTLPRNSLVRVSRANAGNRKDSFRISTETAAARPIQVEKMRVATSQQNPPRISISPVEVKVCEDPTEDTAKSFAAPNPGSRGSVNIRTSKYLSPGHPIYYLTPDGQFAKIVHGDGDSIVKDYPPPNGQELARKMTIRSIADKHSSYPDVAAKTSQQLPTQKSYSGLKLEPSNAEAREKNSDSADLRKKVDRGTNTEKNLGWYEDGAKEAQDVKKGVSFSLIDSVSPYNRQYVGPEDGSGSPVKDFPRDTEICRDPRIRFSSRGSDSPLPLKSVPKSPGEDSSQIRSPPDSDIFQNKLKGAPQLSIDFEKWCEDLYGKKKPQSNSTRAGVQFTHSDSETPEKKPITSILRKKQSTVENNERSDYESFDASDLKKSLNPGREASDPDKLRSQDNFDEPYLRKSLSSGREASDPDKLRSQDNFDVPYLRKSLSSGREASDPDKLRPHESFDALRSERSQASDLEKLALQTDSLPSDSRIQEGERDEEFAASKRVASKTHALPTDGITQSKLSIPGGDVVTSPSVKDVANDEQRLNDTKRYPEESASPSLKDLRAAEAALQFLKPTIAESASKFFNPSTQPLQQLFGEEPPDNRKPRAYFYNAFVLGENVLPYPAVPDDRFLDTEKAITVPRQDECSADAAPEVLRRSWRFKRLRDTGGQWPREPLALSPEKPIAGSGKQKMPVGSQNPALGKKSSKDSDVDGKTGSARNPKRNLSTFLDHSQAQRFGRGVKPELKFKLKLELELETETGRSLQILEWVR
ncbi:hypothetical protein PoB_003703900 [Plakobranchus ocellatus]|uniref:Uncharacterized protein n=1 Tax=Plakobranchus ocellatus TaxID=259542 RepID=A0AAV4ARW2_9GAST|nr:hypothetical protein PoB_003703900 [Plakobranchus ocellatus]